MFERILPVIIALVILQILIRFMQKRKKREHKLHGSSRYSEYRDKVDRLMKAGNFEDAGNYDRILSDEIRSGIAKPELIMEIPDSMRDVRRGLNLIIDGVNHAVKAKTGNESGDEIKFKDAAQMFDELVEVVKKHQVS